MSARECKEDWFPTGAGVEERGGIEFRPVPTTEVVFAIFLTLYVALRDVTLLPIAFFDLYDKIFQRLMKTLLNKLRLHLLYVHVFIYVFNFIPLIYSQSTKS